MLVHTKRQVYEIKGFLQHALCGHVCHRSVYFIFTMGPTIKPDL